MPRKKAKAKEIVKKLSLKELVAIENHHEGEKRRKLENQNLDLKRKLLDAQKNLFLSQLKIIEKELQLLDYTCVSVTKEQDEARKEYREFKKEIQERLKLKKSFGFDDETGVINEEDILD